MNKMVSELFIRWVWQVTSMLVHQSNVFPRVQLEELVQRADALEKALRDGNQ